MGVIHEIVTFSVKTSFSALIWFLKHRHEFDDTRPGPNPFSM